MTREHIMPQAAAGLVAAGAPVGDVVVVWTPTGADSHAVSVDGLEALTEHAVDGGRIIVATTTAAALRRPRCALPGAAAGASDRLRRSPAIPGSLDSG